MHQLSFGVNVELDAPLTEVWAITGDFQKQGLVFGMPAEATVVTDTPAGPVRQFDGMDGKFVKELCLVRDEQNHNLVYRIVEIESLMSNDTYIASVHTDAISAEKTRVRWFGTITVPEDEVEMRTGGLRGVEGMIAGGLKKLFPDKEE